MCIESGWYKYYDSRMLKMDVTVSDDKGLIEPNGLTFIVFFSKELNFNLECEVEYGQTYVAKSMLCIKEEIECLVSLLDSKC